ncbi:undecaprenyl-diphosphatase BcrC [Polycladomyces abyssicola]|uniref:Undecaprenyl-diphosphatase BcrC n=1 Tax=Polycladomyces abyssicola TaxID=1125966 RepID=A0A8D5UIR4_9BACL|nr:undecaprenyl-diphosphatase [Polycladomyces abyssicola]BCU82823.1 undecaprenyl-diphosphatase BcrC [Polycladomyces abyssicola]
MDYQLFQWINHYAGHHPWWDHIFEGLTTFGPYLYMAILVIFALRSSTRLAAIYGFVTASLAIGMNFLISLVYYRPRPFISHHVHLLLPHPADSSFPSDHTTGAVAIAVALWNHNRKLGIPLFILALLIGLSRIYVGHHYPTDVLAGILVGTLSALLVMKHGEKILTKLPYVQVRKDRKMEDS